MSDPFYIAHITDRTTGETRQRRFDHAWHDSADWLWSEGSYGNQRNRAMFFGAYDADEVDGYRFHVRCTDEAGKQVFIDHWRLASADP